MRVGSRRGWQTIVLGACLSLFACQREQTRTADKGGRAEHPTRVFSILDRATALVAVRRLIEQENARGLGVGRTWSFPDDAQAFPLAAAAVDGVGTVIYAAATRGSFVTGHMVPALPVPGQAAGGTAQGEEPFMLNGLFSTSVVLQVQDGGLFRLVNDQWKADSSVPAGTYSWYLGRTGAYLRDTQAGDTELLLAFDSPADATKMRERPPVGLSVEGQGAELVMDIGAKKLRFR